MDPPSIIPSDKKALRQCAEEQLYSRGSDTPLPSNEEDLKRIIYELRVHEIELEIQNEELIASRKEASTLSEKYQDLYTSIPIGCFSLDDAGRIFEVNPAGCILLNSNRDSLIRARLAVFIPDESLPAYKSFIQAILDSGMKQVTELRMIRGDQLVFVSLEGRVIENKEGTGHWISITIQDISSRIKRDDASNRLNP